MYRVTEDYAVRSVCRAREIQQARSCACAFEEGTQDIWSHSMCQLQYHWDGSKLKTRAVRVDCKVGISLELVVGGYNSTSLLY